MRHRILDRAERSVEHRNYGSLRVLGGVRIPRQSLGLEKLHKRVGDFRALVIGNARGRVFNFLD